MMLLFVLLGFVSAVSAVGWDVETDLDRYVNAPDDTYSWSIIEEYNTRDDYVDYVINMTSQTWLDKSWTRNNVWFHMLQIIVPKGPLRYTDGCFLMIDGGNNDRGGGYRRPDERLGTLNSTAEIALRVGGVVAYMNQIPNQPIFFDSAPDVREDEDSSIAHSWNAYLEGNGSLPADRIVYFPMVKAAMRAMDTITALTSQLNRGLNITRFIPSGFSKRGWVAWLLGAVDKRTAGIMPIVLDLFNLTENLHHHYQLYGGWSWPFTPYFNKNCSRWLDTPNFKKLEEQVDILTYNERMTMPKLVTSSSGDEFLPPDNSHYFWDALHEPKAFCLLGNAPHEVVPQQDIVVDNIEGFYHYVFGSWPSYKFPNVRSVRTTTATGGAVTMISNVKPENVTAMQCQTTDDSVKLNKRDFRLLAWDPEMGIPFPNDADWSEANAEDLGNNQYRFSMDNPTNTSRWRGMFIRAQYAGPAPGTRLEVTTEIQVIRDQLPYARCRGLECTGTIR